MSSGLYPNVRDQMKFQMEMLPSDLEQTPFYDDWAGYKVQPLKPTMATDYGQDHTNDNPLGQLIPGVLAGKKIVPEPRPPVVQTGSEISLEDAAVLSGESEATQESPQEVVVEKQTGSGQFITPLTIAPPGGGLTNNPVTLIF